MRVLGIDPGSNFLGLGCVEASGSTFRWVGHLLVRVNPGGEQPLSSRLKTIHEALLGALELWKPNCISVEEVFFAKNPQSALKLGQARGAALVGAAAQGLEIFEYSASIVKQTVSGSGRAEKEQVQRMVRAILGRSLPAEAKFEREDISDALAIAICHLQHRQKKKILEPKPRAASQKKPGARPSF